MALFHILIGLGWVFVGALHAVIACYMDTGIFQKVECVMCILMAVLCLVDAIVYLGR